MKNSHLQYGITESQNFGHDIPSNIYCIHKINSISGLFCFTIFCDFYTTFFLHTKNDCS